MSPLVVGWFGELFLDSFDVYLGDLDDSPVAESGGGWVVRGYERVESSLFFRVRRSSVLGLDSDPGAVVSLGESVVVASVVAAAYMRLASVSGVLVGLVLDVDAA